MKPRGIKPAEWWLAHSHCVLKGLYLAKDEAWVNNQMVHMQGVGTADVSVEQHAGDMNILKIQRMVMQGKVAVKLQPDGEIYEVTLPDQAEDLLTDDLTYIAAQITAISKPMSAKEQADFLASANGHSEASLTQESPFLKSL
jgi:hypothetical protein